MGQTGGIKDIRKGREELQEKVNKFFKEHTDPEELLTPADAALSMGLTLRTLQNYRTKMDSYGNKSCNHEDDFSYKTVIDTLYTRLESRILKWLAQDPGKRATAAALILNKHFGYKDDGLTTRTTNNFNAPTAIKIEMPDELKKLAR